MQGAPPLASPGAGRGAALARRALAAPRGGLAFFVAGSPCCHGTLWGGLPSLPPANAAFSLFVCPHPPTPLPLRGRGRFLVFLCKGLRPLHPRGLDGARHWLDERWRCPVGGVPPWSPARPAATVPCGGACRLCRLPTLPLACFSPPSPFPAGRGRFFVFFMQGASPLASPGAGRGAALARRALAAPGGGLAFLVAGSPCRHGSRRRANKASP